MANGKRKKSKKKIIIFSILGALVVALVLMALLGGSKEDIIQVQTEKVVKRNITQKVSATGTIDPEFKVAITPEVTGEIIALPVKEGNKVKKGQLLISIKGDNYIAQKDRAEASLQASRATLTMRQAELDKLTSEYDRIKELHAKKLSSDSELETAKSNYLSSKGGLETAKANVAQGEASVKEINDQIRKLSIYSPMDGTITQLNVELGERVLGSGYSQGTDIMTVSDLASMQAVVDVDENDVVLLVVGDTARVKVDAFGDKVFKGTVQQIGNSAQSSGLGTQEQVVNFEVKIKLLDLDDNLRPGMSCNADIETETKNNVLSVPIQSVTARTAPNPVEQDNSDNKVLRTDNGAKKPTTNKVQEIVFVMGKNNKVKKVDVKTGISDDNYIEITNGLSGGEDVVSGSYMAISRELKDGSTVRKEDQKKSFSEKQ